MCLYYKRRKVPPNNLSFYVKKLEKGQNKSPDNKVHLYVLAWIEGQDKLSE